ncbi:hypothetical protein V1525DRAFT_408150 [Lipomyces kononenkoae]|uniref:Uncharacterized protein n=1 Tax=Lipomyces kononenkoae TaxID=34357 RepID=A0ACC3SWK6_LIPKO
MSSNYEIANDYFSCNIALKRDPAIDRHFAMRENYEAHFRWTPRTSRHAIALLCVIPGVLLWTAYRFEGKINFEAKKRGDSIWEK